MRPIWLGATLALGLATGAAIAWKAQPSPEDRMLALFRDICLPMANGQPFQAPGNLTRKVLSAHETVWLDPQTGLALSVEPSKCRVDDLSAQLDKAAADRLETSARKVIPAELPALMLDETNELDWDIFLFWRSAAPAGDLARWGVLLTRIPAEQGGGTALSLTLPREAG